MDCEIIASKTTLPDHSFVERLIDFYHAQPQPELGVIWQNELRLHYKLLIEALERKSKIDVERLLSTMFRGGMVVGLDTTWDAVKGNEDWFCKWWKEQLCRLANMVGVLPVVNPEQPSETPIDTETLLAECDKRCGVRLHYNGGCEIPTVLFGNRSIPFKLFNAAAIRWVIKLLPRHPESILEIGAGTGLNSVVTNAKYDIIDLPMVAVLQAYFLKNGTGSVSLHGETRKRICVHGLHKPDEDFDLVLNQNSMPEMTRQELDRYMDYIELRLRPQGFFVSINHESNRGGQLRVHDVIREKECFDLRQRSKWWLRDGYVLEIWQKG